MLKLLFCLLAAACPPLLAGPYTPSYGAHFLVAGSSEPGYADGNFIESAFHDPMGMALSPNGQKLYVADSGNGAIRLVDLAHQNRVSTLCRGLIHPSLLALSSDGRSLYVLDQDGARVQKLASADGRAQGAYSASGPLGIASLAWDAQGKRLLLIDCSGEALLAWDEAAKAPATLVHAEFLGLQGMRLACVEGKALLFDPRTGTCFESKKEGSSLAFEAARPQVPGGQGFVPGLNADGQSRVIVWDGQNGLFKLVHPDDGSLDDFLLYDQRGALLSTATPESPTRWPRLRRWIHAPLDLFHRLQAWCSERFQALKQASGSKRLFKVLDRLRKLWNRAAYAASDQDALNRENLRTDRPLYAGPVSLCFDPRQHLLYVAEQASHRILALKLIPMDSKNPDGLNDLNYPAEKAPGITRILLLGDSFAVQAGRGGVMEKNRQVSKQLELYLNTFNAMHGTGKRYEVLLYVQGGVSFRGSPMSKLLGFGPLLDKYKIDEVIVQLSHATMVYEAMSWSRGATTDDLSSEDVDLGFMQLPDEEKEEGLGPLSKEFLGYLRQHKDRWHSWYGDWPYADGEDVAYQIPLADPQIKALILKKLDKVLAKDLQFLAPRKIKLSFSLEPFKTFISAGEMEGGGYETGPSTAPAVLYGPFQALAAKRGVVVYDPLKMMRLIDPALFPLYGYGDIHWLQHTHQWFAWLLAQQICYGDR